MPSGNVERKLTAILSADVKGYSRLMGEDEEATIRTLTAYRQVLATLIAQHRGRVVDSPGDNLLAEFASAVDAVRGAVEIQRELGVRNAELPPERRMEFRIGINVGDVVVEGQRLYGDGVNIAARLEALAEGGGICIAGTVYDQVQNKLPLDYEYVGEQMVKNISKPVRVYQVVEHEVPATTPGRGKAPTRLIPLPEKPSIIVLPFVNMSQDPEQEYFSDGITEDITTDLCKVSSLFVISRNSAFTYKGQAKRVQDISREMGVGYVLEGSVRRAGDRVRITVQLIDATTDHHLWAERYDRDLKDIFALQDEIVQKIVFALKVKLTQEEQERFKISPTDNLEAYDAFLRGWECFFRLTQEANAQARPLFERAIELDTQYAGAYALLGYTYEMEWSLGWSQDLQTLERAFELTQKAIALDDSLPLAHMALGDICLYRKQHERAIAEGEKAITLNPNSAEAYAHLGFILTFAGNPAEAIRLVEKAMRLDPRYPFYYLSWLGFAYRSARRYEEAIAAYKEVLARNPDWLHAHLGLAVTYSELGQEDKARAEAAEVLRINPDCSLEVLRQVLSYRDPAQLERELAALRKAGLR